MHNARNGVTDAQSTDRAFAMGSSPDQTRILILGGGYAGLSAAGNLLDLCGGRRARFDFGDGPRDAPRLQIPYEITIVSDRDGFFHTIGAPMALVDRGYADKAWQETSKVAGLNSPGIHHVHGNVISLDTRACIAGIKVLGREDDVFIPYDYCIVATGLRRKWPVVPQSLHKSDYLDEVCKHIDSVLETKNRVVVVGGGAVGIEMAAEILHQAPQMKVTLVHSRDNLLSSEPLPEEFKSEVLKLLQGQGVDVILETRVVDVTEPAQDATFTLTLSDGQKLVAGKVIKAISTAVPVTQFLPAAALDKLGLNFSGCIENADRHFAAGDIASFEGIKRCSTAMQMGYYAAANVYLHILSAMGIGGEHEPRLLEYGGIPPGMGLAIGSTGTYWGPEEGIHSGEEALREMFDDDMGWSKCWNHMKLGDAASIAA